MSTSRNYKKEGTALENSSPTSTVRMSQRSPMLEWAFDIVSGAWKQDTTSSDRTPPSDLQEFLRVIPSIATIDVVDGVSAPVDFEALLGTAPVGASWTVDSSGIASVDAQGLVKATGTQGGEVKVKAIYDGLVGEATVIVNLKKTINLSGIGSAEQTILENGSEHDAAIQETYPYDKTVFPKGLLPPDLMWNNGGADDTYVDEAISDIEMAASLLTDDERQVLVLAMYHDFSVEDIAEICEVDVSVASRRLDDARKKIKEYLRGNGSDDTRIDWDAWKVETPPPLTDEELMELGIIINKQTTEAEDFPLEDQRMEYADNDPSMPSSHHMRLSAVDREAVPKTALGRNHLTGMMFGNAYESCQRMNILTAAYDWGVLARDPENINFIDVGILAPKTMWSWQSGQWVEECCDVHEEPIPPVNFNNVADSDDDNKPVILVYGSDGSILASGKKSSLWSDKWESLKKRESNVPGYFVIPISDLVEIGNTDLRSEVYGIQKPPSDVSSTARTHLKNRPPMFDISERTLGGEATIGFNTWLRWCEKSDNPAKRKGLLFICKDSSRPMKEQWTNFAFVFFPSTESRSAETTDMNWLSRGIAVPVLCCDRNLVARTIDSILSSHGERSGEQPPKDYASHNVEFQIVPIETTVFIA